MSTKLISIVISDRSILADGVVATLENGGYDVVQHVDKPSGIKLERLACDLDLIVVLVCERPFDQESVHHKLDQIKKILPLARSVIVAEYYDSLDFKTLFFSHADAFILGIMNAKELIDSLKYILSSPKKLMIACSAVRHTGLVTAIDVPVLPNAMREEHSVLALDRLSSREREILDAMAKGASNKHIARKFGLSEATVKAHVRSIFVKLGARNRTMAALSLLSAAEHAEITLPKADF